MTGADDRSAVPEVTVIAHDVGPVGGMERQLTKMITGLLGSGHLVTVIARRCDLASHPCLRVIRVPCPRRPFTVFYPWFFLAGSVAARRFRRGLIHTTGALVFARSDLSTVHFCHRAYRARAPASRGARTGFGYRLNACVAARLSVLAERWCYRPSRVRCLVAVSEGVATELRGAYPNMSDRVSVIPNGVDRETFRPSAVLRDQVREELGLSASELVAAFVGGEWERKGLRHAIEGLAGAPDWRLIILGEGDQPSYERLSVGGGTASRVHFLGRRTDVARVLAAADAFVLPTEYEAFPLVVLEAAAAGLPLLVSRVNGAVDLIKEGENGFFIGRDAASITEALAALGVNPALRSAQATAARASTEAYGWDRVVEAYGDLLSELTRRSCARGSPSARTPL